jgi:hypothetical protein
MKKVLTNIVIFLTGYLCLLMVACNNTDNPSRGNVIPPPPPSVHTDCTDWEESSTFEFPQFIGHFEIPDRYFVCGTGNSLTHHYWFVSNTDFNLNIALNLDLDGTAIIYVHTVTSSLNSGTGMLDLECEQVYEFFSGPGYLGVINAPVPTTNHGFVVSVFSLDPVDYQMEIWPM